MSLNQLFFKYAVYYPVVFFRGEKLRKYLNEFETSQWADPGEIKKLQERKFGDLVKNAVTHVPYYRESYEGIDLDRSIFLEKIRDFPAVTKSDIKNFRHQFENENNRAAITIKTTGGSTGQAVTILKSREATAQELAANWRGFNWAGIDIGHKQARFWGIPIAQKDRFRAKMIDLVANRKRCSAFSFTEKDMVQYTNMLNRFKPVYFYGYLSMLARYAEFLIATNNKLNFQLKAVISTSEVLTNVHRRLLEDAFKTKVYNEYGCGEIGTIAHECEHGSMHLNSENAYVEILSGEKPCKSNEIGEMVVTELNNYAMPLIRYRLGDFAAFSNELCKCGRTLPVINDIAGRAYDLVYNKEGSMFHGEFFMYIFEEVKKKGLGVNAFQVIQNDYENFTIKIKPENGYGIATEDFISKQIKKDYGSYAQFNFVQVDKIEREKSGKMRLIVGLNSPKNKQGV